MTTSKIIIASICCLVSFATGVRLIIKGNDTDKLLGLLNAIYLTAILAALIFFSQPN